MFRKQVNPKTAAIATLLILASIQFVYWRLLVYRPPALAPAGGGGGGGGPQVPSIMGLQDVQVETLTGGTPGYRDGGAWEAQFSGPNALALQRDGNLIVTDSRNHRIRQVTPSGRATTLAGGGQAGGPGGS